MSPFSHSLTSNVRGLFEPAFTVVVRNDERAVRRGADRLELDRAIGVDVEVLPEGIDRRVRIGLGRDLDREGVELVGSEEVQVAVVADARPRS